MTNQVGRSFPKRVLSIFIYIIALLSMAVPAFSQPLVPQLDYVAGFDGYYRPGSWTPIFVTASNQPGTGQSLEEISDFVGDLLVTSNLSGPLGSGSLRYIRRIDLPRISTKRFTLYARFPDQAQAGAATLPPLRLTAENGRVLKEFPLQLASLEKDKLLLVHVSEGMSRPNLPRLLDRPDRLVVARLDPTLMPDFWAGWDCADVIVLSNWPDRGVPGGAIEALRNWIGMGGTLVMLGGADAPSYDVDGVRDFLPGTLATLETMHESTTGGPYRISTGVQSDSTGPMYPVSILTPAPDAESLLQVEGRDLVSQRTLGLGRVVYFANDLKSQSAQLEQTLAPAWQSALPTANLAAPRWEFDDTINRSLITLSGRAARPPNAFLIMLLTISYAFVVGPLNFYLLFRYKKLELAWITLPVIVLVFFLLIYGIGRFTRTSSPIMREITVDLLKQGEVDGMRMGAVNLFSTQQRNESILPLDADMTVTDSWQWNEPEDWLTRGYNYGGFMRGAQQTAGIGATQPIFRHDIREVAGRRLETIGLRSWPMGTFDARTFQLRGPITVGAPPRASIQWGAKGPIGFVANSTPHDFTDAFLMLGDQVLPIGPLKSGEEFQLTPEHILPDYRQEGESSAWTTFDQYQLKLNVGISDEEELITRKNLALYLTALRFPATTAYFSAPTYGQLDLIGFRTGQDISSINSSLDADIRSRLSITIVRLKPTPIAEEPTRLAGRTLRQSITGMAVNNAGSLYMNSARELVMADAAALFQFDYPFYFKGLHPTKFRVEAVVQESEGFTFQFFALNIGSRPGAWIPIPMGEAIEGKDYILPGSGRIFIRAETVPKPNPNITQAWNNRVTLQPVRLTVEESQ